MANHYITRQDLAGLVREAQALGTMTEGLADAIVRIGRGYHTRYAVCDGQDADDAIQDAAVNVMKALPRLDPAKNLFGYITATIANCLRQAHAARKDEERVLMGYARRLDARGVLAENASG